VAQQTSLLAFDRQNHAGASDGHAATLSAAIQQEAEAMLAEKRVVSSAITIQENADKMKARARPNPNPNPNQADLACAGALQGRCPRRVSGKAACLASPRAAIKTAKRRWLPTRWRPPWPNSCRPAEAARLAARRRCARSGCRARRPRPGRCWGGRTWTRTARPRARSCG